jgi:hypothetical protein
MLSTEPTSIWQQLLHLLVNLPTDSSSNLKASLRQAIEFFEAQILTNDNLEHLPDPIAGKMRSYLTESHRLLRLLPLDVMFMEVTRNPTTTEQRRQAYQHKLDLLIRYAEAAIVALECLSTD